ncbi:MAG: carbohydrate ABC transporter permease [Chloroflexi bacterium]|nr:carbohydrate ABC transporter permease [Chloroflexota bacterium]
MADSQALAFRTRHNRWARVTRRVERLLLYLLVIALSISFFFPLYWTVTTSIKPTPHLYRFPPDWIPRAVRLQNYVDMINEVPYTRWMLNTAWVTVLATLGTVISCCVVGYAFARFDFPGRDVLFLVTLSTMMFPAQITLIPTFVLFHKLGWINTFKPLTVPAWFGGGAFNIFLMRQFIRSLPRDLDESAEIDGANPLRILVNVLLPLCKPALATVAVISFIGHWNDFIGPLIYLQDKRKFTLAVGLNYFKTDVAAGAAPMDNFMMAAVSLSALPCILLFFFAQSYFVQGVVMSGIKG